VTATARWTQLMAGGLSIGVVEATVQGSDMLSYGIEMTLEVRSSIQNPTEEQEEPCRQRHFYILDREGRTLDEWPDKGSGNLLGVTPDGRVFLYEHDNQIEGVDLAGTAKWVIDTMSAYRGEVALASPNRRMILAHAPSGRVLTLYKME
jgi:hypothetical protein